MTLGKMEELFIFMIDLNIMMKYNNLKTIIGQEKHSVI
jgi:hypothetical protein